MFKVGDKVERVNGEHAGHKIGDTGVVRKILSETCFQLEGYEDEVRFDPRNFKLVEDKSKKHPQAEFIKAWLDGTEVEASEGGSIWFPVASLVTFNNKYHFRIKPKSQVLFASLIVEEDEYYKGKYIPSLCDYDEIGQIGHNLKLTIENGELVNVQLIKQCD